MIFRVLLQRVSVPADARSGPAFRMHRRILLAVVLALSFMPGMGVVAPVSAQTPQGEIAGCAVSLMFGATQDALTKEVDGRTERVLVLTSSGCDSGAGRLRRHAVLRRLRRDLPRQPPHRRHRQRQGRHALELHHRRTGGVRHQGAHGRLLPGARHGVARRPGRQEHVRHAGGRCDVPRPRDPQARAEEIQDRRRGVHHLRAADAAVAGRIGQRHDQPRRLRAPQELGLPGQGRAADVPADLLLPDSGGRPGHRVSDSHLRHVDAPGQSFSNAFFWAISRSQDATIVHDWFSKTGQQVGGEYRYVVSGGSQGNARLSFLDEKIDRRHHGRDDGRAAAAIRSPAG